MDSTELKPIKCAFWCGILEGDTPLPAAWREVRTVRGMYTTLREPAKRHDAATNVPPTGGRPPSRGTA